ncbi:glycosyltransferase [Dyadobacter sp. 3J3]|uniref:glycosyltransferase family 2 protein n=1 Tax=Dyadobacter sp. 3J3 TaxID=2606600 RepID=UPI00135930B2|nr:glycosyltransferase [Dyadobacter sp. 3J3]
MPETTVLIPSYNGAKYIQSALLSVLSQKYSDYEVLIIDDGSTDNTEELIKKLSDKRIRYYKNESNMGIVASLNRGLDLAEGKYIARMDADDLMLADRLQTQIDFLEKNKNYGMVGCWYHTIDEKGKIIHTRKTLTDSDTLRMSLIFRNQFAHSSVTMRTEIARKLRYDPEFQYCEDHDLWIRFSEISKVTNLPLLGLSYRWYSDNSCNRHQKDLKVRVLSLLSRELDKLEISHSVEELKLHAAICFGLAGPFLSETSKKQELDQWIRKILNSTVLNKRYDRKWLNDFHQKINDLFF